MDIRPMGAKFFHANGHTGGQMDRNNETNSRFSHLSDKSKSHSLQKREEIL
jgi:hypothetical protein